MNAILFDSTDKILGVLLLAGKDVFMYYGKEGARRHASDILTAVDGLLAENGVLLKDLQYIGVVTGPGSFTGIRIGVATANALAYALQIPVVSVTALEPFVWDAGNAVALLDCKNDNFYALIKKDGREEYAALTKAGAEALGLPMIFKEGTDLARTETVFRKKIAAKEFGKTAVPFYLKKSSAERDE